MHESYDYGLWSMVFFNVILFSVFVFGFLRPKKKYEWHTLGVFTAFIGALFIEMYGFPLTIYVLISLFGSKILSTCKRPFTGHPIQSPGMVQTHYLLAWRFRHVGGINRNGQGLEVDSRN